MNPLTIPDIAEIRRKELVKDAEKHNQHLPNKKKRRQSIPMEEKL